MAEADRKVDQLGKSINRGVNALTATIKALTKQIKGGSKKKSRRKKGRGGK